ncbi:type IV pilus biogenesis protein PilM [Natranaerobius trueperi]|uniref:Pilus assembly protein PilM n=1 Tax=Natranaerobius trueperi TaxID=759412 RepID=A0A226C0Y8_9FIRM|nr:pilus assembly protein PilM [Natranaerobius trueperi]OWZ84047.1 hypothetical protein CDO51_05670 [Natranaerobius trueperi]
MINKVMTKKSPLGIDLGPGTIRIVELVKKGTELKFNNIAVYNHSISIDESIKDLGESIKKCLKRSGFKNRDACLALRERDVIIKTLNFPVMSNKELSSVIEYEADKHLMFPKEMFVTDWSIIKRQKNNMKVLFLASNRNIIDKYVKVAEFANLRLKALDVEVFSLLRYISLSFEKENAAKPLNLILDLGLISTTILIAKGSQYIFSRNISFGTEKLVRQNLQKAVTDNVMEEQIVNNLIIEIERSIEYLNIEGIIKGFPIQLLVTGRGWEQKDLLDIVTKYLGLSPILIDPFQELSTQNINSSFIQEGMTMSIATSLALRNWVS